LPRLLTLGPAEAVAGYEERGGFFRLTR